MLYTTVRHVTRRAFRAPFVALLPLAIAAGASTIALAQCPSVWVAGAPGFPSGASGPINCISILPGGALAVGALGIGIQPLTGVTWYSGSTYTIVGLPNGDKLAGGDLLYRMPPSSTNRYGFIRVSATGVASPWTSGMSTGAAVFAMAALPDGDVIVAGSFTSVEGVSTSNIVRYNPATSGWSALGGGVNGTVRALVLLPGGDVLVGGSFTAVDGLPASSLARYNPATNAWSAVGAGITYGSGSPTTVRSLCVMPDGDVLIGGSFDTAGDVAANNIARCNLTTGAWSALGTGTNNAVVSLAVLASGDIVAGGDFTTAGDVPVNRIARYRPSSGTWSALGTGVTRSPALPSVYALTVLPPGVELAVGGYFTAAGGVAVTNLARYIDVIPDPTFSAHPLEVTTQTSGNAVFFAQATGWSTLGYSTGTPNYQWRKDGVAIPAATNPTATTTALRLTSVQPGDLGSYDCIATNPCGGAGTPSNAAALSFVGAACNADFNGDGFVDFTDFDEFVAAFEAGC